MKRLLIVDDEAGIVEEVREYFQEEGFEVHTADTVRDGILQLDRVNPDIVVLDIKLPDQCGLEVLRYAKKSHPSIKVIVNTGYVDQALIDEAEELGRDAFLQKPFDLERLQQEISRFL
ncbi:MAG: response regulator [Candidatus Omnitrophica bacterium]|nr:response regulator [Candidatus Omnitrophota bacterium]